MEQTVKNSQTIINKHIDEWVDEDGRFHRKSTFETITNDPLTLKQASLPVKHGVQQKSTVIIRKNLPMRGMFKQQPQQVRIPPYQPQQMPIDIGSLIKGAKKFLDESGLDFNEFLGNLFKEKEKSEEPLTNEKEVDSKCVTTKTKKPQKKQNLKTKKKQQKTKKNK